jgi:predicted nucleic acid-binding protein
MRLDRIEKGTKVFIDANIFIYHFTGTSYECSDFLKRCEQGEIMGITSLNVYLEVLHRLMMVEAVKKNLVHPPNIVKKLKKYPEKIKLLNEYFINTQKIIEIGITVKPILFETILKSHAVRTAYGLMVNDSLIAASLHEEGITSLATNDAVFSKIEGISIFKPGDINSF